MVLLIGYPRSPDLVFSAGRKSQVCCLEVVMEETTLKIRSKPEEITWRDGGGDGRRREGFGLHNSTA